MGSIDCKVVYLLAQDTTQRLRQWECDKKKLVS